MGEKHLYQPLARWDAATVIIYRLGIALSAVIISIAALGSGNPLALLLSLYASVGLSVFFIHLYISRFKRALVRLYLVSLLSLVGFFILGKDASALSGPSIAPLLLLPLAGCLGFIAAKEAFCFKLFEGYVIALLLPVYLLLLSAGARPLYGLPIIAGLLVLFTARKVFMPLHCDIGDKSAYR